ncbi:glycoside hydrolase family 73 protein [Dendrosporobacter sp. 1207_IL3150]|uniref:glycoside hydrolase family 73 protein n=1 Tax=Dendrosporobacter sp. 1207_IL3150 TaxID=3084054 RepID=UPI002FDA6BBA
MTPEDFLDWLSPVAKRVCKEFGLFSSVCIAQGALESGWGEAIIGKYNLFGRKWNGVGKYIEVSTQEYYDGEYHTIVAKFQDYDSLEEAVKDWCFLITEEPVYSPCLDVKDNLIQFVETLSPIYATDPHYADKIISTIRANDLTLYDD